MNVFDILNKLMKSVKIYVKMKICNVYIFFKKICALL